MTKNEAVRMVVFSCIFLAGGLLAGYCNLDLLAVSFWVLTAMAFGANGGVMFQSQLQEEEAKIKAHITILEVYLAHAEEAFKADIQKEIDAFKQLLGKV